MDIIVVDFVVKNLNLDYREFDYYRLTVMIDDRMQEAKRFVDRLGNYIKPPQAHGDERNIKPIGF